MVALILPFQWIQQSLLWLGRSASSGRPPPSLGIDTSGITPLTADPPISIHPPTTSEIEKALGSMKAGKAAGVCGIPTELLKAGGGAALRGLAAVFNKIWNTCEIPADWRRGIIIPIFKGKGNRREYGCQSGVTFLSALGKLFARFRKDTNHLVNQISEQWICCFWNNIS